MSDNPWLRNLLEIIVVGSFFLLSLLPALLLLPFVSFSSVSLG